jgi:hypothetical protein
LVPIVGGQSGKGPKETALSLGPLRFSRGLDVLRIELRGRVILIDKEDAPIFYSLKWAFTCNFKYLVYRGISLRRAIMGLKKGDSAHVDHINGNGLDNRKSNLRLATRNENLRNQRTRTDHNKSSKYKGVWFDKSRNKYRASITINGKCKKLGTFGDQIEAAKAYNQHAADNFGEFAVLNVL